MSCPVKTKDELLKDMRNFVVGGSTTFKVLNNGDIFIPFGLSKNIKTKQQAVEIGYKKIDKLNDIYKDLVSFLDTTKTDGVIVKIQPSNSFLLKNTLPVESTNLKGLVKELNRYTPDYYNNDYFLMEQEIKQDFDEKDLFRALPLPFINYQFKAVDRILNNKKRVDSLWNQIKEKELFWNKIQQELQIPKEQIELLKQSEGDTIEEKLASFAANYSYTVEINTAKEISRYSKTSTTEGQFFYEGSTYEDRMWEGYFKNNIEISQQEFQKASKEYHSKRDTETQPTQYHSDLKVPGGTNYTEQEIATPAITPSIKGHAQFATDQGIGWFRSDDKAGTFYEKAEEIDLGGEKIKLEGGIRTTDKVDKTKTRRILEVQSDLFQKGRDKKELTNQNRKNIPFGETTEGEEFVLNGNVYSYDYTYKDYSKSEKGGVFSPITKEEFNEAKNTYLSNYIDTTENQFLQLLNKDNNWVTFFVKSIIQDSAKKGYEKILFPRLDTIIQIESGGNYKSYADAEKAIKDENWYKKDKELKEKLEETRKELKNKKEEVAKIKSNPNYDKTLDYDTPIQNLERLVSQAYEKWHAIQPTLLNTAKFYENDITNILNKQYGKENVKQVTDEYGNTWNEIDLNNVNIIESVNSILFALPSIKTTSKKDYNIQEKLQEIEVKPGVPELFDSNPKLANAVYEALGVYNVWHASDKKIDKFISENVEGYFAKVKKGSPKAVFFTANKAPQESFLSKREYQEQFAVKMNNPLVVDTKTGYSRDNESFKALVDRALANNHDGVIVKNVDDNGFVGDVYISLNANQISKITPQQKQQAQQLYSSYLDTIFPDSKVKDIVYHTTYQEFKGDKFNKPSEQSLAKGADDGIYFSKNPNYYTDKGNKIASVLDLTNPMKYGHGIFMSAIDASGYRQIEGSDGFITYIKEDGADLHAIKPQFPNIDPDDFSKEELKEIENNYQKELDNWKQLADKEELVFATVFEPEQIHILGSKQDIEGFKEWIKNNTKTVKKEAIIPLIKITSEEDYDIQEKNLTDLSEIIESFNDTVYDKFIRYKNSLTVEQIKKENKFVDLEDFIKLIEDPVQKSLINRAKKVNPNIKIEISEKYEGSVYDKKNNIIYISLKEAYALSKVTNLSFKKQLAFLITHEYTHAGIEKILNLPENLELKKQFKLLHEEFLSNNKNKKFNDKIRKGFLDKENFYQEDLSEFIADLSNPYLREYLNNIGIWEKIKNIFKNLINSLFGTNFKLKDSVLNRMMDLYYSTEIENAFLNFTDKNVEDFNESKVLFRALPENVEEELDDKYKTITGKYKAQILALKKRLTQLKNSRDKKPLNSPEWTYYNNLVIKIANGLNLLNDTNRQEIIYDLGKELLFQSESYILGLEKGTISAKNKDLKYTNEIIKAFYPDLDTGDYTGLESKAMELANRLTPFRKKFIEAYVNEHLNSEDKEKTYEDIEKQKEDIGKFRKLTGALSDLGNYLANTIGSIIKEAQNNITVTNKKVAEKIQIEVDLLRDWSKKNGVQEENMYDVFIQEYKGTLILTKSTLEDGTKNENYYKIINTPELKRFYDFHKKMMEEANNDLPVELGPNFIANIQNSFMDDIQNKGVIKSLKGVAKNAINIINYNQIDLTEPKSENLTSDKINLKYIQKLAPNEKSRDLGNSLLEYIKFTNEYKVMTEILPEVRLLQQEIGSKEYRKQGDPNKVIEGKKSNIYQMVDDYINMQVKGEMKKNESITVYDYDENGNPIKAKNLKIDSIIDFGLKYNSLLRIGLNPINAISNVFIGYLGNLIESVGGRFFSFRELNQASAITIKNFFDEKSDFTKAILELNPLQEFEEYNIYNEIKLNKKTSPEKILEFAYSPQRIGEKYLQGKVMVAVLIHNGFMDFNGKFTPKWFTLNEKEKSQLTDKIQRINQMIHGRYSSRDAATAQQYVLYRLISQFRKWIPSAIESRFGEKVYDKRLGVYIEGRYNTYKKFFRLMSAKLKNDQEMILANEFTELDIYNMKKNAMEIALIAASLLAYGGLKGDDDDKNFRKKPIVKFLLNQLNRISGELLYFYNPEEYATLASKAIPLAKTTNDLIRVVKYLPYAFYDYDGKANYRSGIHKGQNKFYVSLFSTLPLFKPGQDIFDVFNKQPYQEF